MSFFDDLSVFVAKQRIRNQIFDELAFFRIIQIPQAVMRQNTEIEFVRRNDFGVFLPNEVAKTVDF